MKGHGEKFSHKREHAIAALLSSETMGEAARACGVAPVTLWRWLQDPSFESQYRAAREQVVERVISDLQFATVEAVVTLRRNLNCENPAVQVRAAQIILEQANSHKNVPEESDEDAKRALEQSIQSVAQRDNLDEAEAAWGLFERLRDDPGFGRLELWPASVAERSRLLLEPAKEG